MLKYLVKIKANSKQQQSEETKKALLKEAQNLFASKGFANTRFDEVASKLNMTSGVLYHHFKDKADLFEHVTRNCQANIRNKIIRKADLESEIFNGILEGCCLFITEVISKRYKRIILVDSLSVLGWEKWKAIDDEYSEASLREALDEANERGLLKENIPIGATARLISGATNDLALWISASDDPAEKLKEARRVLSLTINNLKKD